MNDALCGTWWQWFAAIVAGRVNLDGSGEAVYSRPANAPLDWKKGYPSPPNLFLQQGIAVKKGVRQSVYWMWITCLGVVFIQVL